MCACALADKLSPFHFYQYLLTSVGDADVGGFLRKLTFLPVRDIAELEAGMVSECESISIHHTIVNSQ